MTSFTDHMTSILQKTQKENKTLFIMGDFNINLLNYQSHSETNDFINLMVSHYLLPHILHPTRVTDHSATIIDNIFTNNAESDTISGNNLSQISDHFPQFLIMKNVTIDYCNVTLFQHDYSKFSEQAFVNSFNKLSQGSYGSGKTWTTWKKGLFLKKIRENLENSGNFLTIFTTAGKTQGILICQISLPSSLGHLATNQTNVLLTGTLTNPVTAF